MRSRWSDADAANFVARHAAGGNPDLALRAYTSRLLGAEDRLVLHGGGNTSVKGTSTNRLGDVVEAMWVKASGEDLATIEPAGFTGVDLGYLRRLRALDALDDEAMAAELRAHRLDPDAATPSLETLVHAFLPERFVDHTHADAILTLTNQAGGERAVRDALGDDVIILPYLRPGFPLALAVAEAYEAHPGALGMVWMRHGLMTWGPDARTAYEATIALVTRAEDSIRRHGGGARPAAVRPEAETAARLRAAAPALRGALAAAAPDGSRRRAIVVPLVTPEARAFVDARGAKALALTAPLTSDHLIRTKAVPAWVDAPAWDDAARLAEQVRAAVAAYAADYERYVQRHAGRAPAGLAALDPLPRVLLLPGLGALCAGPDVAAARVARDVTAHTLAVKADVAAMGGTYEGLPEAELFDMEYHTFQHAKLARGRRHEDLTGHVALVTGAAGAIGSGICRLLLEHGAAVAAADLPGDPLDGLVAELAPAFGPRVLGVPMDVTDAAAVAEAFGRVVDAWGGLDLVVVNAGVAHVAGLAELDLEAFHRLTRVNVDGALLTMAEAARHFARQGAGGDIVLVSTKNVFAPGARFGAYSATKAAAHQLARIASLELAEADVRVNMVAPDAVFSDGARRSGLWREVGPDRMRARGLDEAGLEDYYRNRNLLKARVTAEHVGRAVLFFATRQTPTTGATIPVDGGLPDATPR